MLALEPAAGLGADTDWTAVAAALLSAAPSVTPSGQQPSALTASPYLAPSGQQPTALPLPAGLAGPHTPAADCITNPDWTNLLEGSASLSVCA